MAGGEGFEPSTPNLGGWCSIRTELLAHSTKLRKDGHKYSSKSGEAKQFPRCPNAETVRQAAGHKNLNTTQKYMAPARKHKRRMWIVEGTTDKERAKQLLSEDFAYVMTTPDGYMTFRKSK